MQPFKIIHEYEGSAEDFWAFFFDHEYNRRFHDAVEIDVEVVREESVNQRRERVVRYRSRQPVPALMRSFLPDGLGYTEHGIYDPETRSFTHRIEPNAFGARTEIRGTMRVEDLANGKIRRIYEGTVTIKVPIVGGRIEADTIRNMQKAQDAAAAVTRQWLSQCAERRLEQPRAQ
jgi:hypothetical protein